MDATLQTALQGEAPFVFGAVEIVLPTRTLRLLDGSAEITIDGQLFTGDDATFGTLDSVDSITETMDEEAPQIVMAMLPPDDAAAADLASSAMQGGSVKIMLGAYDPATGNVVGVPEQLFLGEIDVPTIEVQQGSRRVSFTVVSVFERLFEMREGERASDGWHKSIWPGEKGFEHVTGTVKNLYWGTVNRVPRNIGQDAIYYYGGPGI